MPNTTLRQRFSFTSTQKKVLFALASMVGLRMLGLFLVLPVFTLYGLRFTSSKFLVGFAFGAYALTMAILQIPLGRLSDRIGRRKVLVMGMTLFSVGSFLCALPPLFPHSWQIWELIFGRLVQGGGAIISVAFATVADYIEPERRSTAMAVLGIPIGVSFAVGIIGGPILAGWFGTASLFWMTGFLGLATDFLLVRYLKDEVPRAGGSRAHGASLRPSAACRLRRGRVPDQLFHDHVLLLFSSDRHRPAPPENDPILHAAAAHDGDQRRHHVWLFPRRGQGLGAPARRLCLLDVHSQFPAALRACLAGPGPQAFDSRYSWPEHFSISASPDLSRFFPAWSVKPRRGHPMERPWAFTTPRSSSEARWEAPLAGALANFPPERTLFTMMIAAAIGFLMMVATKPPARAGSEPQ